MTATLNYKKLDLFQSSDYCDTITETEYEHHNRYCPNNYTPNKPNSHRLTKLGWIIIDYHIMHYYECICNREYSIFLYLNNVSIVCDDATNIIYI